MAKKKLKDLLDAALGLNEDASIEDALAVINKSEEPKKSEESIVGASVESTGISVENATINMSREVKEPVKLAYNVEQDPATNKFKLITVSYTSSGLEVKEEIFASSLPEVNYKLGKLIIEKLIRSK